MVKVPTKSLTLAEFLQLPETEPASEYINLESESLLPTPEFMADFKLSVGELFGWLKPGV